MSPIDGHERLTRDRMDELVRSWCFPQAPDSPGLGRVGLEAESFPIGRSSAGDPAGRLTLGQVVPVLAAVGAAAPDTSPSAAPAVPLPDGGWLTVEPGGQVEHVTPPRHDAATALAELDRWQGPLDTAFSEVGAVLAAAGMDVWQRADEVPQQLAGPRYPAMAAFFRRSGTGGHTMMCHTSSLQVNLDLGPTGAAEERWLLANLVAPLLTASFATSPVPPLVSGRADAWHRTDPSRTGFPRLLLERDDPDPVAALVDAALSADVLLIRDADGGAVPGRPGRRFGEWLAEGHPVHGPPSVSDLAYHLTTLFHEVRLRGWLEVRAVDALPRRWRTVPVVLLVGLLYDDRARRAVRGVLEPHRAELPELSRRAAVDGVADPAMCALAVETWSLALAGAGRLPAGYLPASALVTVERFLDRFTLRGRCPADELRDELNRSPGAALAWAAEPATATTPA